MIKSIIDWLVYEILKMPHGAIFSDAADFFLYDTAKIFLLLTVIIFIVSIIKKLGCAVPGAVMAVKDRVDFYIPTRPVLSRW